MVLSASCVSPSVWSRAPSWESTLMLLAAQSATILCFLSKQNEQLHYTWVFSSKPHVMSERIFSPVREKTWRYGLSRGLRTYTLLLLTLTSLWVKYSVCVWGQYPSLLSCCYPNLLQTLISSARQSWNLLVAKGKYLVAIATKPPDLSSTADQSVLAVRYKGDWTLLQQLLPSLPCYKLEISKFELEDLMRLYVSYKHMLSSLIANPYGQSTSPTDSPCVFSYHREHTDATEGNICSLSRYVDLRNRSARNSRQQLHL